MDLPALHHQHIFPSLKKHALEICAKKPKNKKKKNKTKPKGHQNSLDAWALMHSVIDDGKSTTSEALFAEQTGAQASTQHILLGTFIF
jgi:hypothetical protein